MAGFIFKNVWIIVYYYRIINWSYNTYVFANFLKDLVKEKFLDKFRNLEKFNKSEFVYLLILDLSAEYHLQFQMYCLASLMKASNFFLATFLGITPQIFLVCSLGSGLDKIIEENLEAPSLSIN